MQQNFARINHELSEAVLYGGGSFTARSAQQIWEACISKAEAHDVPGFPLSCPRRFRRLTWLM